MHIQCTGVLATCVLIILWLQAVSRLKSYLRLTSPPCLFSTVMADAQANQGAGRRRREERQERQEEVRNVRQRMDEAETRLDEVDTRLRGYETRLKCLEAPYRVVLRGFESVRAFLTTLDAGDFKGAKTAFIPSFIQEIRDKTGPEVNQLVEELDTLLCERQGWVVLGVFPTGGMKEDMPDGLVRLQPGGVGNRVSTLCSQISLYLADSHQMFQDRVRRDKGDGKGKAKGKGGGRKGGKGKAKGLGKLNAQPKRAV